MVFSCGVWGNSIFDTFLRIGVSNCFGLVMEQLTESWNNMSLSEKEQIEFILPEDYRRGEFTIAAKFLASRFLQMEAVARTFKQLWRTDGGFKIRNQRNNLVLFLFNNLAEVDKTLKSQPWSFDKHLIVMQRYMNDTPAKNLAFDKVPFWV